MSRFLVLVAAALVAAAAIGGSTRGAPVRQTAGTIRVVLHEVHHSGQHGLAVLSPHGKTFTVSVTISPPRRFPGPYPDEHIHKVTCKQYARIKDIGAQYATVDYTLNGLPLNRKATTTVSVPLSKYTTGHYSINVHARDSVYTTVVCGDIPKR